MTWAPWFCCPCDVSIGPCRWQSRSSQGVAMPIPASHDVSKKIRTKRLLNDLSSKHNFQLKKKTIKINATWNNAIGWDMTTKNNKRRYDHMKLPDLHIFVRPQVIHVVERSNLREKSRRGTVVVIAIVDAAGPMITPFQYCSFLNKI